MEDLSAYRSIFIEELIDQLDKMDQDLLSLEQSPSDSLVQSLFRAAHTIKGSSATMGFIEMNDLTHEIEHILQCVREKKMEISPPLINLLFQGCDFLKLLRDEYINGSTYSNRFEILNKMKAFVNQPQVKPMLELPELSQDQQVMAEASLASGLSLITAQIRLAVDCQMKGARLQLLVQRIEDSFGSIIVASPAKETISNVTEADDLFRDSVFLIRTLNSPEEIRQDLLSYSVVDSVVMSPFKENEVVVATSEHLPAGVEENHKQIQPMIRVSVERLEHLMNLVGELLIDQTSLAELNKVISSKASTEDYPKRLSDVSDHMSRVVKELQDSVMKARMLPIEQLFNRFPRMVRDLSHKLGKELELILEGGETELDRTIIDELGDPLIHLMRNAADHGIETADIRLSKGKSAKGIITLKSFHEDNQVVITLEDDGNGIYADKIISSAIHKGVITEEKASRMTENEAIYLIFEPGFSTASSISDVSGRGVGMDIVRNQIERLKGIIEIATVPGQGTKFTIRLPLTLAIIKGLLVKVSARVLVIPMHNVVEIIRIRPSDVQTLQGEHVITNHGQIVPLYWLNQLLGYPQTGKIQKTLPVVIVRSVDKTFALVIDEIVGNQEVVIKSLGSYLGKIRGISGATILGSGRVAVILEVADLIK